MDPREIQSLEELCIQDDAPWCRAACLPHVDAPKAGHVAVVGAGLSGLTAALELAGTRHAVTLFEASDRLGVTLRQFPPDVLPPEVVEEELGRLGAEGVEVRLAVRLGRDVHLAGLVEQYGAVYLAPAKAEVTYQGHTFPVDVLACPVCGLMLIPEDLVRGRMLEVEQTLEEK